MKILITGGSGFIASHVIKACLKKDIQILVQSRKEISNKSLISNKNINVINKSFLDLKAEEIDSVDSIIHLASVGVTPQIATWQQLNEINISGSLHICELAKLINAKLFVSGSYAEYGDSGLEHDCIPVDATLKPTYPYAISKAIACELILAYTRYEKINTSYLRIFNAYGEGQNQMNLWPSLISAAKKAEDFPMTPGEQIRDFINVQDVAQQLIFAATKAKLIPGRPLVKNCASGKPQSVKEFCQKYWNLYSTGGELKIGELHYRKNEVMKFVPSLEEKYL